MESTVSARSEMEVEVTHRLNGTMRVMESLGWLWKSKNLSMDAKVGMQEKIVPQSVGVELYGKEKREST